MRGERHDRRASKRGWTAELLVVRIPMRFQRRAGRKRTVALTAAKSCPTSKPQPDGTLVKALARAWRWQRMLDEGVYTSVSEIGDAENISKSYVRCSNRGLVPLALLARSRRKGCPTHV